MKKSLTIGSKKAAKQGYIKAQCATAMHHAKGIGVTKDYIKAYAWMTLANRTQNPQLKEFLHKIGSKLTDIQIIEATTLADKWQPDKSQRATTN